jgi:hypothetical protein
MCAKPTTPLPINISPLVSTPYIFSYPLSNTLSSSLVSSVYNPFYIDSIQDSSRQVPIYRHDKQTTDTERIEYLITEYSFVLRTL